jgi:hypothetical protein
MWSVLITAALAAALGQGNPQPAPAAEDAARTILAKTAEALGGATALARVQSLRAEGHTTRAIGPLRMAAGVDLVLERPGRYVRREAIRLGGMAAQTVTGFDGPRFIQSSSVPQSAAVAVPAAFGDAAAAGLRQELTLFLIGFLGEAFDGTALRATSAGTAESAEGRADAVRLLMPNGIEATLFVDSSTGLPLMISWRGGDPSAALTVAQAPAGLTAGQVGTAEHRFHFSDYRPVGDVRWPFLVRHSVDGRTIEELRFDRFVLNPAINADEFQP